VKKRNRYLFLSGFSGAASFSQTKADFIADINKPIKPLLAGITQRGRNPLVKVKTGGRRIGPAHFFNVHPTAQQFQINGSAATVPGELALGIHEDFVTLGQSAQEFLLLLRTPGQTRTK
jgi:hypothetical protein